MTASQAWAAVIAESYLLGSIPFGYLLVRIVRGEDVRASGSGNIGATNVSRKSPVLGVITLLLDALKGAAAVEIAYYIAGKTGESPALFAGVAALFAIVGHIFPLWLAFRGGKGVATSVGVFALIAPKSLIVSLTVFAVLLLLFRYVSLASIIAVALFSLLMYAFHEDRNTPAVLFCVAIASLLIIIRHRANIQRLIAGTESRLGAKSS